MQMSISGIIIIIVVVVVGQERSRWTSLDSDAPFEDKSSSGGWHPSQIGRYLSPFRFD